METEEFTPLTPEEYEAILRAVRRAKTRLAKKDSEIAELKAQLAERDAEIKRLQTEKDTIVSPASGLGSCVESETFAATCSTSNAFSQTVTLGGESPEPAYGTPAYYKGKFRMIGRVHAELERFLKAEVKRLKVLAEEGGGREEEKDKLFAVLSACKTKALELRIDAEKVLRRDEQEFINKEMEELDTMTVHYTNDDYDEDKDPVRTVQNLFLNMLQYEILLLEIIKGRSGNLGSE